jgi:hypothetical protein
MEWTGQVRRTLCLAASMLLSAGAAGVAEAEQAEEMVTYHTADVDGIKVFYRQAGPAEAPVVLLLHGFPASSHMFRDLLPGARLGRRIAGLDLPTVFILEGGYATSELGINAAAVVEGFESAEQGAPLERNSRS